MFTKRHYELIADYIKNSVDLSEFKENMITFFMNDNPNFNEKRFREEVEGQSAKES